uniref:Cys_knot domain-containing protein n=1 Tax=Haemonchus contortus TaxID=6289 RepID=A0A7I5ECH8_HAECO|nr:glycoprotein hormone beta-5 [Haemonchus contortus]
MWRTQCVDPSPKCSTMFTVVAALLLTTVAAPPLEVTSKSKCEYFLQRIPGMNPLVLTDSNGKKCRGVVEIPVCRGYCKTSESGTYMFPYRVQNSSACALIVTGIQVVPLTDCDFGADESIRSVSIPSGERCGCKKFPFN